MFLLMFVVAEEPGNPEQSAMAYPEHLKMDSELRSPLKKAGTFRRDPRKSSGKLADQGHEKGFNSLSDNYTNFTHSYSTPEPNRGVYFL